jgi:hypothetical protein
VQIRRALIDAPKDKPHAPRDDFEPRRQPVAVRPGSLPLNPDSHQLVLTVWCSRSGEFAVRVVLPNGTLQDFASPFELARFVAALARSLPGPPGPADSGPPAHGLR